jgi:hypothetical protein
VVIIALSGPAGSGKNTVASMLRHIASFDAITTEMAFADPMKAFAKEIFDFTHHQLYGPSEARNGPDGRYTRPDGTPLTPRFALQTLGTEWGRNCDPELWVKYALRKAAEREVAGEVIIITDCRFANEAKAVRAVGGQVWFVDRPSLSVDTHPSEAGMLTDEFQSLVTYKIHNHSTLEALESTVCTLWQMACTL